MKKEIIVGVDVGGTNVRFGAVDTNGSLYAPQRFASRSIGGIDAVQRLLRRLNDYILSLDTDVEAVSIGFPSTLDRERSMVINTPNLGGFDNVNIVETFTQALKMPVFIDKDATMLLRYDMHINDIVNRGIIIGIYVGTGLGNSIIINGEDLVGRNGVACELGHIPVPGRHDPCSCGLNGCLELYAAGKYLEQLCRESFPGIHVGEIFEAHMRDPRIMGFVENIADAAALEINLFNPDALILGGGVLAMQGFPRDILETLIRQKVRKPIPGGNLRLIFSENQNPFNGVVGAALFAKEQMRKEKKDHVSSCQ